MLCKINCTLIRDKKVYIMAATTSITPNIIIRLKQYHISLKEYRGQGSEDWSIN